MIEHLHTVPQPPTRVVLLGATGFVGRSLAKQLKELKITTCPISSAEIDLCAPIAADQLRQQLRVGDALVFVSALTPDKGRDIRTMMRNMAMGEHVCAALREVHCGHVVYISSDAVYPDASDLVSEDTPCHPASFHGLMHLARELMLVETAKQMKIPLLILRPSLLYGAGDTHNGYGPNRFMRLALEGKAMAVFGQGEEKRDHIYVDDVGKIITLGLMHRSTGAMNIATGISTSFWDVAHMAAAALGKESVIESKPRGGEIIHRHFDIALTRQAFPSFVFTGLARGLAKAAAGMAKPL